MNMKLNKHLLSLSIAVYIVIPGITKADWVTDFVDRATVTTTQAGTYESNGRHYATAGGGSIRWSTSADYPISINPPRLGGGCGGIDAYLGGVSFLDEEYLVQKIEAIITNAPAIAFDIAMKQMSAQLSETIGKFEDIINGLNNLQLDDCGIANAGVVTVMEEGGSFGDAMSSMWEESISGFKQGYENSAKNRDTARSSMDTQSVTDLFDGCTSVPYKNFMNSNGSVLTKLADPALGLIEAANAPMLRANIGDISMNYDVSSGAATGAGAYEFVSGECGQTAKGLGAAFSRYINDGIYVTKGDGAGDPCTDINDNAIRALLESAINKFLQNPQGVLTDQERNAVYMTGLPLDVALKAAETNGQLEILQQQVLEALPVMYSYNMFRHEVGEYSAALNRLKKFFSESMQNTDKNQCPREPAEHLVAEISKAQSVIKDELKNLSVQYKQEMDNRGIDPYIFRRNIEHIVKTALHQKHLMMQPKKN